MADWTETYRPTTRKEVRGNDKARDELWEWAETWGDHREAAVVHGSPGVGKTSAAHALAADKGWDVVELNASDQRTADVIERIAGRASKNESLAGALERANRSIESGADPDATEGASGDAERQLIVLDEADNIHHQKDYGGQQALSDLIKEANQPIILLANDYYDLSRGLQNAGREIKFRDVTASSIKPILRNICRQEGIEYAEEDIDTIADANAGDIRGAVKDLQAHVDDGVLVVGDGADTGERDRTRGIFDFMDDVFKEEDAEGALQSAYAADETPDDLINWIEDNLPKDYEGAELARAYGFLANADKWLGRVRATQNYTYWRYATDNMAAGVAAARDGPKGGWTRYGPPSYWRKLGSSRASRDKRDYVARKVAETSGTSIATARRSILPYLAAMTHHCKNRELTVAMAAAYDLEAEHVAFVTGSGKDTNKVQDIVADAESLREEAAVEHSGGAFEGGRKTAFGLDDFGGEAAGDTGEEASATTETNDGATGDDGGADAPDDGTGADADEPTDADEPAEPDDDQASFADFS